MRHRLEKQTGIGFLLLQGQGLRVITPTGGQVSDLFCFNSKDTNEIFSAGRTLDYADRILLTTRDSLYSNRSRKMLTIEEDDVGVHDLLMPPCSLRMFQIVADNQEHHPSCLENLGKNLVKFGMLEDHIQSTFNIFMNVAVQGGGRVEIKDSHAKPQDSIFFRAEMDLYIGLTACSHPETNGGECKPIEYEISSSIP